MPRHTVLIGLGLLYLSNVVLSGVLDARVEEKSKENETEKKKPNILKDYVCLRDGELCHPEFGKNRGLYVSCSNGVAWEQNCPKCTYHPITCPTKNLWFDGEKCEWASPKLASQPCVDKIPLFEINNNATKDGQQQQQQDLSSEQQALLQSLQTPPIQSIQVPNPNKEQQHNVQEKNKWPVNPMSMQAPGYFKSPKSADQASEPSQDIDSNDEVKEGDSDNENENENENTYPDTEGDNQQDSIAENMNRRNSADDNEQEFPTYLSPEDASAGSKIVRLNEPVYALVNSPNGSGKQVLMRVFQPFVLEDPARSLRPGFFLR